MNLLKNKKHGTDVFISQYLKRVESRPINRKPIQYRRLRNTKKDVHDLVKLINFLVDHRIKLDTTRVDQVIGYED